MVERVLPDFMQLILPFAVLSKNRKEPFTRETEEASIFCLAEMERTKGGGVVLKQSPEQIISLTGVCYPFCLVPWNDSTLLLDGLSMVNFTATYEVIPSVKTLKENMERSTKTVGNYVDFLSNSANYLQTRIDHEQIMLDSLITDQGILDEFAIHLSEATQIGRSPAYMTLLPPLIDEAAISIMEQELDRLRLKFQEEINSLYEIMKLLVKVTNSFAKILHANIKATKEEFDKEIRKHEILAAPQIGQIQGEYEEQVAALTEAYGKQILQANKEKSKLEKAQERMRERIERCKVEARTHGAKRDKIGERRRKETTKESKKEVSELQRKTKELQGRLHEIEDRKSADILKLRSANEGKMAEAKKDLTELEASRDAKIQTDRQEMERLKELTSATIANISGTLKMREAKLAELGRLVMKQKCAKSSILYVPFYTVCYQSKEKRRYVVFTPSVVGNVSLSTKLKGALGGTKIKQLLNPRFKALDIFLNRFALRVEQDVVLERELNEKSLGNNLLVAGNHESMKDGLARLKLEGWLSEKEYDSFIQALS